MRKLYTLIFMICFWGLNAQEYFPKNDGVKSENQNFIAFTNATIHLNPDQVIKNASLLIQNGKVKTSKAVQYDSNRQGYYWNEHITPEKSAFTEFKFDDEKAKELLKEGFGVVNKHAQQGIIRGNGVLVTLNTNKSNNERVLPSKSVQYLSFEKSKFSKQVYPNCLMGSMDKYSQGTE